MRFVFGLLSVVVVVLAAGCGDGGASRVAASADRGEAVTGAGAPVFAPARVHDAIREAGSDGLVVLVFGAAWCGPCQLMERTVWTDRRVEDWLSDRRAIVLRSDADEQREEKDAFDVSAWPTVIVLRRGEVVERRVGYQTAEQVMGMLREGAGTGVVELRVVPAK